MIMKEIDHFFLIIKKLNQTNESKWFKDFKDPVYKAFKIENSGYLYDMKRYKIIFLHLL